MKNALRTFENTEGFLPTHGLERFIHNYNQKDSFLKTDVKTEKKSYIRHFLNGNFKLFLNLN